MSQDQVRSTPESSPRSTPKRAGPSGTIVFEPERCKGCELCIPACPPHVLRMSKRRNSSGYLLPELLEGCTGCGACLLVCPDYCFEVYRFDKKTSGGTR
jgi:2-oxoglutarate ferredoxin oxidoreductase subunit delta